MKNNLVYASDLGHSSPKNGEIRALRPALYFYSKVASCKTYKYPWNVERL